MTEILVSSEAAVAADEPFKAAAADASHSSRKALLTAEWRNLVMLNYEIEPEVLMPFVPCGTELDLFQGRALVSVVGFEFLKARWCGLAIPAHGNFPEVNLRFYVKRRTPLGWRRGVVFIKEIAPRWMVTQVARRIYHENYCCCAMRHAVERRDAVGRSGRIGHFVDYQWREAGRWNRLALTTSSGFAACEAGTEAEFVVDHFWCYTPQPSGATREYQVEHPSWRIAAAAACELTCSVADVYGPRFERCLGSPPSSAFLVDGSAVVVHRGEAI